MPPRPAERARFFRADDLAPLECLDAFYTEQVFAPHFHEEYVVNTLTAGAQSYHYHGSAHLAGVGALIAINPGEVHTGASAHPDGWAYRGYYPSADFMRALAAQVRGTPGEPYFRETVIHDPDLAARLAQLQPLLERETDRLRRESALLAVFGDVVIRHMGVREAPAADDQGALERARQRLADRIADNVSLAALAAEVGLSPWHLSRSFHRRYGLPPVAWRNQLRIARARALLARGTPVSAVASELGFADQPHFTRVFRAALGVTPGAYRRALGA